MVKSNFSFSPLSPLEREEKNLSVITAPGKKKRFRNAFLSPRFHRTKEEKKCSSKECCFWFFPSHTMSEHKECVMLNLKRSAIIELSSIRTSRGLWLTVLSRNMRGRGKERFFWNSARFAFGNRIRRSFLLLLGCQAKASGANLEQLKWHYAFFCSVRQKSISHIFLPSCLCLLRFLRRVTLERKKGSRKANDVATELQMSLMTPRFNDICISLSLQATRSTTTGSTMIVRKVLMAALLIAGVSFHNIFSNMFMVFEGKREKDFFFFELLKIHRVLFFWWFANV